MPNPEAAQADEVLFCVYNPEQDGNVSALIQQTRGDVQSFINAFPFLCGEKPTLIPWKDLLRNKDAVEKQGLSWQAVHPDHLDAQGEQDGPVV